MIILRQNNSIKDISDLIILHKAERGGILP